MTFDEFDVERFEKDLPEDFIGLFTKERIQQAFEDATNVGPKKRERMKTIDLMVARELSGKTLIECLDFYLYGNVTMVFGVEQQSAYIRYICRFFPKFFTHHG